MVLDPFFVDGLGNQPAGVGLGHGPAHEVRQFLAARVVEGDLDESAGTVSRRLDGTLQLLAYGRVELLDASDGSEAKVVLNQGVEFTVDEFLEQRHEGEHLVPRTFPVLGRKSVQSDDIETQPGSGLDCFTYRADAGAVAFDARKVARLRPPTVPVHDDGDMARQAVGVETLQQLPFVRARLSYLIVRQHHSKHLDCEVYHSILVPGGGSRGLFGAPVVA